MLRPLICVLLLLIVTGCTTTRRVTIGTNPPDAIIKIDGLDVGRGPVTEKFQFTGPNEVHRVTVNRRGYQEAVVPITRDFTDRNLMVEMKPLMRRVSFTVKPAPAIISIDGKRLVDEPVLEISTELELGVDQNDRWKVYTVTAERPGFAPAIGHVTWLDESATYVLELPPMRKDVTITTEPSGAEVFVDGQAAGASPTTVEGVGFHIDPETNEWTGANIQVQKPGYDPVEQTISWDDARAEYHIALEPNRKDVRIVTDPPDAVVTIDGEQQTNRDESGAILARLSFPPVNDEGDLRVYEVGVSKKTKDAEWYPTTAPLAWDGGKGEYTIKLKPVLTEPVELISLQMQLTDGSWRPMPVSQTTLAMKGISEGPLGKMPARLTISDPGTQIDVLAMSPDGSRIVFNVLRSADPNDFRSQIMTIRTDGNGGQEMFSDGRTLDITPSYTPDGSRIVFSSNRATPKMSIWEMSASGAPGITQLTSGESTSDLWPVVDSDPKPRLFYQAHVDNRPDPRLFMTPRGNVARTDLSATGTQPRVSPRGDAVVFVGVNANTGKRDLFLMPDRGGQAENMTNTPEIDEFHPSWSWDGSHIAFAADRGLDEEKRRNFDIWTVDVRNPGQPTQITVNGSWDDSPVWSPSGDTIYFRSNRGGEWGIWKIAAR